MIRWVVYLLRIFKMFHGLMNNPVFIRLQTRQSEELCFNCRREKQMILFAKIFDWLWVPPSLFWCWIHLWFRLMGGGLQAKSMTSQRYRAVTRWRICVTMATLWQQQDGGYALLWQRYDNNKMVAMRYYGNVMTTTRWWLCVTILHLQQYSHRLNFFFISEKGG